MARRFAEDLVSAEQRTWRALPARAAGGAVGNGVDIDVIGEIVYFVGDHPDQPDP